MYDPLIMFCLAFLIVIVISGSFMDYMDKRKFDRWNGRTKDKNNIR